MSNTKPNDPYSETYRENCFQAWYAAGRPSKLATVLEVIPPDDGNRKPTKLIVSGWLNTTWMLRADELDAKAIQLADDNLIVKKAEMLKAQAQRGEELQKAGMEHIKNHKFDTSSAAVSAIIRGAELERTSRGIGELIVKMAKMSDGDLKDEIMKRLEIISSDNVIDAETKEEEETKEEPEE